MTETEGGGAGSPDASSAEVGTQRRKMSKTPMFTATHAARYSRQDLIRQTDEAQRTTLICYVGGERTGITRDDTLGFVDLLHNIGPGEPIDLMLHTCGGDVDACEKLIFLLRAKLKDAPLRVIIPEMAKSAGTILALAAQKILMSSSSELGMIDPQYEMKDSQGNFFWHSVVVYLKTYDQYCQMVSGNTRSTLAERMLLDFDAKIVAKFRGIEARIRNLAESILKRNNSVSYTTIVNELLNSDKWRTHGQPIGYEDAIDLGLPVEFVPMEREDWQKYWSLYCLQRREIGRDAKMFESGYVSQIVEPSADLDAG